MNNKSSFKHRSLIAATLAGSLMMGFGANAMADSTDDIVNALIAKGVLTEEEGALLMKGRAGEKEAADAKKKTAVSAKFKDGLSFESGDGEFKAKIAGRVHTDYRAFDYNDGSSNVAPLAATVTNSLANVTNVTDTFDIRRARIGFEAKYKEFYDAVLSVELASSGNTSVSSTVLDVGYLNVAWWQPVQFRFGQFKAPMNLEKVGSSNNTDFLERSFVNALAPNEQIGAMVHGIPTAGVTYQVGAFNGGPTRQGESDIREDGKEFIGRATVNFAEIMGNKDMISHVGISYANGDLPQGAVGASGRTEARGATFFRAPVYANSAQFDSSNRDRLGLEGVLAYNQFKLQGEWLKENDSFSTATRGYDLDTKNYYVEALWTITGEKYADLYKNGALGGIKPTTDFDPKTFKGGAWEIGLRYSKFDASDYNAIGVGQGVGVDANVTTKAAGFAEASAWTAGVKFLPNSNTRLMLNYVDTSFDNAIGGATGGIIVNNKRVDNEKALTMRAQWMF
jgi:phosphate-selective porin OprO and OprP